MKRFAIIFFVLLIGGCNSQKLVESFLRADEIAFADNFYDALSVGDIELIRSQLSQELLRKLGTSEAEGNFMAIVGQIAEIIPDGEPLDVQLAFAFRELGTEDVSPHVQIQRFYQYEEGWVMYILALTREDERLKVQEFFVSPISNDEVERNEFSLSGKSFLHYAVLLVAVAVPVFVLYALISCLRSSLSWRRKTLWGVFIVLGLMQFTFNWTTGEIGFKPLSFQLFGAGFFKAPLSPVLLYISIPVGAWFWLNRGNFSRRGEESQGR